MKNPADAARAPDGETYVTTGTEECRMAAMISRIDRIEAARSVDGDENQTVVRTVGGVNAGDDVFRENGLNLSVDLQFVDVRARRRGFRSMSAQGGHGQNKKAESGSESEQKYSESARRQYGSHLAAEEIASE